MGQKVTVIVLVKTMVAWAKGVAVGMGSCDWICQERRGDDSGPLIWTDACVLWP